ncbi:MAG: biopolymer transporter ExbD, partial [Bacteroidota bacterium]
ISEATKLQLEIAVGDRYSLDGVEIAKEDIESKLQVEMEGREDKTLYLVVDKNVPTGATVEMIGMAKENKWQVLLGSSKIKK